MTSVKWSVLLIGICCVLLGCAEEVKTKAPVKAVIVENGQPVKFEGDDGGGDFGYEVALYPADGGTTCSGMMDDGEVTIYGPGADAGVPPGEYRVGVYLWGPAGGSSEDNQQNRKDLLEGKYSKENTQMTVDIKPGVQITIDLGSGTVQ